MHQAKVCFVFWRNSIHGAELESEWSFRFLPRENDIVSFKNSRLFDDLMETQGTGNFYCRSVCHELIHEKENPEIKVIINLEPEDRPKVI